MASGLRIELILHRRGAPLTLFYGRERAHPPRNLSQHLIPRCRKRKCLVTRRINRRFQSNRYFRDMRLIAARLYITNLPSSKIQKEDLRRELYTLFCTYGPVLDVVALRTMKMRGQAHIVYRDIQTATQAMRALQGFEFHGREMVSVYSIFSSIIGFFTQ